MTIERIGKDGFIATGKSVETYRLLALSKMVKMEKVGLRRRGFSAMKDAQRVTGLDTRDHDALIRKLEEMAHAIETGDE